MSNDSNIVIYVGALVNQIVYLNFARSTHVLGSNVNMHVNKTCIELPTEQISFDY